MPKRSLFVHLYVRPSLMIRYFVETAKLIVEILLIPFIATNPR